MKTGEGIDAPFSCGRFLGGEGACEASARRGSARSTRDHLCDGPARVTLLDAPGSASRGAIQAAEPPARNLWSAWDWRTSPASARSESTYRGEMITQAEIDALLEAMQAQFEKTGDDDDRPGLITFTRDDWVGFELPTCCTSPGRGIRYRGIKINVSKERETRIWTRGEAKAANDDATPYEDLKSREDAKV